MSKLQENQLLSFLKILQIPTDQTPDQIKKSLMAAGWNEVDASEAVKVLDPKRIDNDKEDNTVRMQPQIVAQRYGTTDTIQNSEDSIQNFQVQDNNVESNNITTGDVASVGQRRGITHEKNIQESTTAHEESDSNFLDINQTLSLDNTDNNYHQTDLQNNINKPDIVNENIPLRNVVNMERDIILDDSFTEKIPTGEEVLHDKIQNLNRPHSDAPWLENKIDIYDVSEKEREQMIRTVYRTNERLSPQTIHALLGIDVDLTEIEQRYQQKVYKNELSLLQIILIIFLSILLSVVGFIYGMYYFEVGAFHPSVNKL